jgi:chemotaxis protein methyltransferase CheR
VHWKGSAARMNYNDRAPLRPPAFILLRDLISQRTGIHYDDGNMDLMVDKIGTLMSERGIDSAIDYYYLLKYGQNGTGDDEWSNVLNAISVRETFFWREFDQIRALVDIVIPMLSERKVPITIWSAACASGEEPLTIAMALDQCGWFQRVPVEIFASDASSAALAVAKNGIYRDRAFRNLSPELRRRYFTQFENDRWKVEPGIHGKIRWRRANLMVESEIMDLARAQIIFCRNVFIYFSPDSIRKTVNVFSDRMPDPGFLFLGAAESLLKFTTDFDLREIGGAFVYVKSLGDN